MGKLQVCRGFRWYFLNFLRLRLGLYFSSRWGWGRDILYHSNSHVLFISVMSVNWQYLGKSRALIKLKRLKYFITTQINTVTLCVILFVRVASVIVSTRGVVGLVTWTSRAIGQSPTGIYRPSCRPLLLSPVMFWANTIIIHLSTILTRINVS